MVVWDWGFREEEAYSFHQTAEGAWELFDAHTHMMKGLFNYHTAYRTYTQACLQEFVDENIQYAEIRVNSMQSSQVWLDDGSRQLENRETVELIIDEYQAFSAKSASAFKCVKLIYCTPRSSDLEDVKIMLDECLNFKSDFPDYIGGFTIVGQEAKGRAPKDFVPQLMQFQQECADKGIEIPFLLHCSETLDIGTDVDRNLAHPLLLGSRRIGHGFALSRRPYIME
ncbi:hypothetical protein BJ170DRAFT_30606 [Xylariales sp. AK1849]|nr:hypothetical protein BJ170DRAFT_30606 [Xylariales sp. AK1849]